VDDDRKQLGIAAVFAMAKPFGVRTRAAHAFLSQAVTLPVKDDLFRNGSEAA
jgi:hypothetical protein